MYYFWNFLQSMNPQLTYLWGEGGIWPIFSSDKSSCMTGSVASLHDMYQTFNSFYFTKDFNIWTVSQGFEFTLSSSETDLKEHNSCMLSIYTTSSHFTLRVKNLIFFPPEAQKILARRKRKNGDNHIASPSEVSECAPHYKWNDRRDTWKLPRNWMLYL